MLSNQILQRTINEIGDIIECNCSIWNTDGVMLAAVGKEKPSVKKAVCSFLKELEVTGVSEEHLDECYGLFPVYDDDELTYIFVIEHNNEIDVHTSGRLSVCQLESLLRSGSERLDRNRFIQNLLLDNLLLVDIYNQAKKLGITVEQRRVVYLIEPKNPDDTIVLDMIRGIYSSGTGDFVTAVDEGHIILIKSLDSTDDYDTIRSTADMLVNAINGSEVDCILSALSVPLQEDFIAKNRNLLDARVWVGVGNRMFSDHRQGLGHGKLAKFLLNHIFKREMEKNKLKTKS